MEKENLNCKKLDIVWASTTQDYMKKEFYIVCFMSFAAVYAVSSAFAAQTQTDLYTSSTYEAGVSCDLLDPSIWKVGSADGEQFAGSVAETADNINFLGQHQRLWNRLIF
ncbi:MAG: hypothetical protein DBY30_06100 [Verrucomicrobia bacterium]|nr:MAG: hypothetical protein DBY30_06100 [Verrucomicrobiota bacterium]